MTGSAPACQFYFADFAMDTIDLTNEQVGAYIRLLCVQWEHGSIPSSDAKRARILHISTRKLHAMWEEIGRFFDLENDVYVNPRMERERLKQAEYREKKQAAGRKGGTASASSKRQANVKPSSSSSIERELTDISLSHSSTSRAREVDW